MRSAGSSKLDSKNRQWLYAPLLQVERVFDANPAHARYRQHGVSNRKGHPVAEFNAGVGRMDSWSRHLLKVETDAVADSRDVELSVTSFRKDRLGCGIDVPITCAWFDCLYTGCLRSPIRVEHLRCFGVGGPTTNVRVRLAQ